MAVAAEAEIQSEVGETLLTAVQVLECGGQAQPGAVTVQGKPHFPLEDSAQVEGGGVHRPGDFFKTQILLVAPGEEGLGLLHPMALLLQRCRTAWALVPSNLRGSTQAPRQAIEGKLLKKEGGGS